VVIELSNINVG